MLSEGVIPEGNKWASNDEVLNRVEFATLERFALGLAMTILRSKRFAFWTYLFPGDDSEEETPDPIPNSAVKLLSADDTATGGKVGHRQVFISAS